jgi:hypothetical protein
VNGDISASAEIEEYPGVGFCRKGRFRFENFNVRYSGFGKSKINVS